MDAIELLTDHVGRIHETFHQVAEGLDAETLHHRPDGVEGPGNSIAWLLWHLARVQDDHVVGLVDPADGQADQAWGAWRERFGAPLGGWPLEDWDTGYGHSSAEVAAVRVDDVGLLLGYHDAVHRLSLDQLARLDEAALDRVVDDRWDPPVTAGVRFVSLLGDALQHLGQAAYVKGLRGA